MSVVCGVLRSRDRHLELWCRSGGDPQVIDRSGLIPNNSRQQAIRVPIDGSLLRISAMRWAIST
jgi:hypothetical protein